MTASEQRVLGVFRQFLIMPGQMLCFNGPQLKSYESALRQLSDKGLVVKERFKGGYTLTGAGFVAVRGCD